MLLDLGIPFSWELLLLIPVSIAGGLISHKFTCLAYSIPFIYVLDVLIRGFNLRQEPVLPYASLMILVGVLHTVEGLLTALYGGYQTKCVVNYKEDKIAGGYQAYKRWYIPLLFFVIQGIYIPILAVLIYTDETFTMDPKRKAKSMGLAIGIYGIIVITMGYLAKALYMPLTLGILFMVVFHEVLFVINRGIEAKKLCYNKPKQGVRIIEVTKNEAICSPFKRGDIILSINENRINTSEAYEKLIEEEKSYHIKIRDMEKEERVIVCDKAMLLKYELILLPEE